MVPQCARSGGTDANIGRSPGRGTTSRVQTSAPYQTANRRPDITVTRFRLPQSRNRKRVEPMQRTRAVMDCGNSTLATCRVDAWDACAVARTSLGVTLAARRGVRCATTHIPRGRQSGSATQRTTGVIAARWRPADEYAGTAYTALPAGLYFSALQCFSMPNRNVRSRFSWHFSR